jgi:hypothetical protein
MASLPWRLALLACLLFVGSLPTAIGTASPAKAGQEDAGSGLIAYVRGGKEIHVIKPDGTGDRLIWSAPQATPQLGVNGLAWRPDGKELAFTSGHAAATSIYHTDVYAIHPDGTGLRRVTNAPDPSQYGKYKKGTVKLTVRNSQLFVTRPEAKTDMVLVYIAGAPEAQRISVPVGTAKTVTFQNVADFGDVAQQAVAIHGRYRWFIPGFDVKAGQVSTFPELVTTGDGVELHGAFRPVWRSDGSRISFRNGLCMISSVPVNPPVGEHVAKPMFSGKNPLGTCSWDWGPAAATAGEILYTENDSGASHIWRIKEGGTHPGTKLTQFTNIPYQMLQDLHWLPDASGLLYSNHNLFKEWSNIFRYDFASKRTTQVTKLDKEFVRQFSISPDGQWIVFERGKSLDEDDPADLWITRIDGSQPRLLVKNALRPAWSRP